MPKLIIEKGPDKGKVVAFSPTDTAVIGREPAGGAKCTLHDGLASRQHCRLEPRSDGFWLVDGESMNGTFLNGHRTKTHKLVFGDKIEIGESMLSFLSDSDEKVAWPIGQIIRGYEIKERVGRGGMGTVYKAVQRSLARVVAFKLLSQDISGDRKFLALFFQEARAAGQLNHPNIVQTYDTGSENGAHFISMEFMPGGSVQDVLAKSGKLPLKTAVAMMLDAARGLEYAEKKQLIHRDIKPDNLMIGEGGVVKIGDLGLAKSTQAASQPEEGHAVFGTPHYIAPEQALNKPIDHRADLYALGSTLYRILTGTTPYAGSSVREIVLRKLKEDPTPIEKLDPLLPPNVCSLVTRLMAREPNDRPKSAADVVVALEEIRRDLEGKPTGPISTMAPGASTVPISAPAGTTAAAGEPAPRGGRLVTAAIFALLLIGGAASAWWWQTHAPTDPDRFPHVVRPPDPPKPIDPDEKMAEEFALALLDQADDRDRSATTRSPAAVQSVISAYQKVVDKFPKSKGAATAKDRIVELEAELRSSALEKGIEEIRRGWGEALKAFAQAPTVAEANSRADLMVKNARDGLEALRTAYAADAKAIEEIGQDAEKIETWAGDTKKASTEFDALYLRMAGVPETFSFSKARLDCQAYLGSVNGKSYPFEAFARALLKRVNELETAAYREAEKAVQDFLDKEDPENADERLGKLLKEFGERADAVAFAAEARVEIKRLREVHNAAQREMDLRSDRDTLGAVWADAIIDDFGYAFSSAAQRMGKIVNSLKTGEVRVEAKALRDDYDREQALFKTLIDRINSPAANGKAGGMNGRKFRGGQAAGANAAQLSVEYKGGGRAGVGWQDVKPKEFCDLILDGWDLSGDEAVALAIFCVHHGMLDDAAKRIEEAVKAGAEAGGLDAAQAALAAGRQNDPLEEQARVLWALAQNAQPDDAKRMALALLSKSMFLETDLVKKNKKEIQKLAK